MNGDLIRIEVLKEVPSGKIQIRHFDGYSTLCFDCSCMDALPFCRAMCCRKRDGFVVLLDSDEVHKYKSQPYWQDMSFRVLQDAPNGDRCIYLDNAKSLCTIHKDHPRMCRGYACSPGCEPGNPEIVERQGGWIWS